MTRKKNRRTRPKGVTGRGHEFVSFITFQDPKINDRITLCVSIDKEGSPHFVSYGVHDEDKFGETFSATLATRFLMDVAVTLSGNEMPDAERMIRAFRVKEKDKVKKDAWKEILKIYLERIK